MPTPDDRDHAPDAEPAPGVDHPATGPASGSMAYGVPLDPTGEVKARSCPSCDAFVEGDVATCPACGAELG